LPGVTGQLLQAFILIASRAAFGDAAGISLRNVVPAYSIITGVTPFSDGPPLENREGG
jgi:hypothetical protein